MTMATTSIAVRNAVFAIATIALFMGAAANAQSAESILQKTRDTYVGLKSYSDTGVILHEYGTSSQDRHTFTTLFNRAPRGFLLDFRKDGGERSYVIWGDPDAFHTWWRASGDQVDYPNPNNIAALSLAGQTYGAAMKTPTLLYGKSALAAKMLDIADPVLDGSEDVNGHRCYRITGRASDVYTATGKEVNVHRATVWIDAESFLVRKMLEESKPLPGQRSRDITTFEPQANPALDAGRFKFKPPEQK
jgi:outer membrane lipoprotein-sorting protein